PRAVLLRHQTALQAIGEARDDALKMRELLVEGARQAGQFLGLAQILGRDRLVELRDVGMIVGSARLVCPMLARPPRLVRGLRVAHIGIVRHIGGGRVHCLARAVGQFFRRDFHLLHAHAVGILRFLGVAVLALILLAVALAGLVLVFLGIA